MVETLIIPQTFPRFSFSFSTADTSQTRLVHAKFVCSISLYVGPGLPVHVHPMGVSLATGLPYLPLSFSNA